tara:strand:+ start:9142 stop:10707 length:1566 start_codon:yes stop_codon:yes gene_type:complete
LKFIFILYLSFLSYFSAIGSLKAAEKINVQFEEMTIPIEIDQLSKLVTYKDNSTELLEWFKENGFQKIFELSKYLEFPIFKEEGFTKQIVRSWIGRKLISEMSNTIIIPNDKNGVEVFNTIERLLETNSEISTLDLLRAIPNKEITLDIDNLILIISSWKNKLSEQQTLVSKIKELRDIDDTFNFNYRDISKRDIKPLKMELKVTHRNEPLSIEVWMSENKNLNKELVIFMPGLGGDIANYRWLGSILSKMGWPTVFIEHEGSNSMALKAFMEGDTALPGGADFYLYRLKDLNAVINAHANGFFGNDNGSYILMGHSLGSLISFLYEGNPPKEGFDLRCDEELKDFALTNLSKLLQCQLSEIPLPELKNSNRIKALVGFNSFGSLIWPTTKSSGIEVPVLLIGGTFDLITPILEEQFKVFSSTLGNSLNRFLVVEGGSHFSPIRIKNEDSKEITGDDVFKINETFIGQHPNSVQNLAIEVILQFLINLDKDRGLNIVKDQNAYNLRFHILDNQGVRKISGI